MNQEQIGKFIAEHATSINDIITKIYYPAGLYVDLIQDFKVLDLVLLFCINIIPAIIFVYVASIFYFKIISESSETSKSVHKYKELSEKSFKAKTPLWGLIGKEMKRFFSSPVFVINAGFGLVIMFAVTIGLIFNFDGIANAIIETELIDMNISELRAFIAKIFYGIVIFTSCMTSITSSMISIEGKSINITKSLPVSSKEILLSKILTSNLIVIPVILICDIIFFIAFGVSFLDFVYIILATIIFPTFVSLVGLIMNLRYPNLTASSDTEVVKQSWSATVSVFIGMIVGGISFAVIIMCRELNLNLIIGGELLLFSIIICVLWHSIKTIGVRKWNEMTV